MLARCSQSRLAAGSPGTGPSAWRAHSGLGRGGVLAEAADPVVHRFGQFAQVPGQLGRVRVTGTRLAQRPGGCGLDCRRAGGGFGRRGRGRCRGRRSGSWLATAWRRTCGAVEAGGFGFAQGPPEPGAGRVVERLLRPGRRAGRCAGPRSNLAVWARRVRSSQMPPSTPRWSALDSSRSRVSVADSSLPSRAMTPASTVTGSMTGVSSADSASGGLASGGSPACSRIEPGGAVEFRVGAAASGGRRPDEGNALCNRRSLRPGLGSSRRTGPAGRRARRPGRGRCRWCGRARRGRSWRRRGWRDWPGSGAAG